ncbi:unnamed protein product [Cylicocyclus nassatus]|uniref:ShKT domain-containing protein n=1 Tax=Cylicocyclus nassatus TaxID=53992 RepID=A0AA36DMC5_CYLNA|nr:unnamed protein product [Cylicocyclus nassatus]
MLVYLFSVGLLSCVNTALIRTANEVEHIYHKNRQIRQACFDRVNPRTGVSDCAGGVNPVPVNPVPVNPVVPVNPGTTTCFDRVDPRTGVSDCASRAALCTNPIYQQLMWEQCPLTCGRCPGNLPNSGGINTVVSGTTCFDRVDPRTGVSDCAGKAALCANPAYQQIMWEQCPLTCNRCPGIL